MKNSIGNVVSPLRIPRGILLILNYVVGYMFVYPRICAMITLLVDPYATQILPSLQFLIYVFMIVVSILLGLPILKESYQSMKHNQSSIIKTCFFLLIGIYFASILLSMFANLMSNTTTSVNQSDVTASIQETPYLMIFTTLVFAPIVEEVLFRGVIFRYLRASHSFLLAALLSSLAFGFIHVSNSLLSLQFNDLWYIVVYAGIGFFFARCYEKTNTIAGPMFLHFLNNLLSVLAILL